MQGRKAVEKVGGKVGYINLCCIKGRKLLVIGPPYYEVYPEQVVAVQGSPSKQRQLAMDREQARLWRQQEARIADQELCDRFNQVTIVVPPGFLKHPPRPQSTDCRTRIGKSH